MRSCFRQLASGVKLSHNYYIVITKGNFYVSRLRYLASGVKFSHNIISNNTKGKVFVSRFR